MPFEEGGEKLSRDHHRTTGAHTGDRKVRPLGHGRTGWKVAHDENTAQVNRRTEGQVTVGLAMLHCSGINAGTSLFPLKPFSILLSILCTVNLILGTAFETKATVCKVLLTHLNSSDELRPGSFPKICSAVVDLLHLLGFKA